VLTPDQRARVEALKAKAADHRTSARYLRYSLDEARVSADHQRIDFLKWAVADHVRQAKEADEERADIMGKARVDRILAQQAERARPRPLPDDDVDFS
jgi:ferritin